MAAERGQCSAKPNSATRPCTGQRNPCCWRGVVVLVRGITGRREGEPSTKYINKNRCVVVPDNAFVPHVITIARTS